MGASKQDYASVLRWLSFINSEFMGPLAGSVRMLVGLEPYNKKTAEDKHKAALAAIKVMEDHLLINTFLVGERLSLADLYCAGLFTRGYATVLDKAFREEYSSLDRWFQTIIRQKIFSDVAPDVKQVDEAVKYQAPKRDAAPKKEQPAKSAPKAKGKAKDEDGDNDDEEADEAPAPKPKHPLEALDRATFVLDDWKRKYSNEDTRSVALPWIWENCNFEEYSLWRVDYKYNEELTKTFMTSNLIGESCFLCPHH